LLTLTSAGQSFLSVSLSAPAGGFALVMADVDVFINHATGTFDNVILKVSTSAGDVSTPATTTAIVRVPSEYPAGAVYFVVPVHFSYIFPVAAGSTTFHLNAYESSATGNDRLLNPRILAVYLPSSYGTVAGPTSSAAGTGGSGFDTSLNK